MSAKDKQIGRSDRNEETPGRKLWARIAGWGGTKQYSSAQLAVSVPTHVLVSTGPDSVLIPVLP